MPAVTLSHRSSPDLKVIYLEHSQWKSCEQARRRRTRTTTTPRGSSSPSNSSTSISIATNTPATTLSQSQTPLSPSLKSESSLSISPADATTPSAPRKPSVPAWSQPRSWAGLASKDGTSFTTVSYVPSTPAPASEASVASSSATSPVKTPAPARPSPWTSKHRPTLEAILSDSHTRFSAPLTAPRGLINTGNYCFANSILQVLVFCAPFYNLFTTVGAELSADLANTTPLMESVVQFLREFQTTRTRDALSAAQAEPFVPEFVYEAMRLNKRFDLMRRGHQEDAEEFLGFFLDTLHEELLAAIQKSNARSASAKLRGANGIAVPGANGGGEVEGGDGEEESREVARPMSPTEEGWLEVGQKGKTAFTRTASTSGSPITRIFGGKLRSVLRTPGAKDSVTLEPYQPLQLDIQPPTVQTVEDALLNLTVPETIPGVYSPARGGPVDATKQVFIESLPPVLVLHLKRFFYDEAAGGVQKNSKEVGYSEVLQVGGDMVSPARRADGPVTYRLFGVVYHHGRYATGGHYTVDVLRQDGSSWVHFDDTIFHTVPSEHVGRRAGQNISSSVGHDGLAYLLFYQREDALPKLQQNGKSAQAKRMVSGSNGRVHSRTTSASTSRDGATTSKVNGSGISSPKAGAAASSKKDRPTGGAAGAAPSPPAVVERQIPGAAPGKTRRVGAPTVTGAQSVAGHEAARQA